MPKILLIDDEPTLLRTLSMNLTARGYNVETGPDASAATVHEIDRIRPDLLVLDLGLPDKDGMQVLRELRTTHPGLPIVILSARIESHVKAAALDLGAADYITKPFCMDDLLARLRSAMRRVNGAAAVPIARVGDLTVDFDAYTVTDSNATEIHLTPTEWRILEVLLTHPRSPVPAQELLTALRGDPNNTESKDSG